MQFFSQFQLFNGTNLYFLSIIISEDTGYGEVSSVILRLQRGIKFENSVKRSSSFTQFWVNYSQSAIEF